MDDARSRPAPRRATDDPWSTAAGIPRPRRKKRRPIARSLERRVLDRLVAVVRKVLREIDPARLVPGVAVAVGAVAWSSYVFSRAFLYDLPAEVFFPWDVHLQLVVLTGAIAGIWCLKGRAHARPVRPIALTWCALSAATLFAAGIGWTKGDFGILGALFLLPPLLVSLPILLLLTAGDPLMALLSACVIYPGLVFVVLGIRLPFAEHGRARTSEAGVRWPRSKALAGGLAFVALHGGLLALARHHERAIFRSVRAHDLSSAVEAAVDARWLGPLIDDDALIRQWMRTAKGWEIPDPGSDAGRAWEAERPLRAILRQTWEAANPGRDFVVVAREHVALNPYLDLTTD